MYCIGEAALTCAEGKSPLTTYQRRYAHFIASVRQSKLPSAIAAIELDANYDMLASKPHDVRAAVSGWHVASCITSHDQMGKVKTWHGTDFTSTWTLIRRSVRHHQLTWLITSDSRLLIAWMQLWKTLENGQCTVYRSIFTSLKSTMRFESVETEPCMVLEAPPTVVMLRLPGLPGKLLLLDTRNLGIERCHLADSGKVSAESVLCAVKRIHDYQRGMHFGGLKVTASSQAFHSFRFRHMDRALYVHGSTLATELERKACYGGRCEVFRQGVFQQRIYHLDFKAMYHHCMLTSLQPVSLIATGTGCKPKVKQAGNRPYGICAEITVDTAEPALPSRSGMEVVYRVGRHTTTVCGADYDYAHRLGIIKVVHRWALYELANPLHRAATEWAMLRQDAELAGDRSTAAWAKACINGLVGKFSQCDRSWRTVTGGGADSPFGEWYSKDKNGRLCRYRALDWQVYREVDCGLSADSIPAITAWIMAEGRQRLFNIISYLGSGHLFYVDTDSVIVDEYGYDQIAQAGLIRNGAFGWLQLKGIHSEGVFYGKKHYTLDGQIVHGGVTADPSKRACGVFPRLWTKDK